MQWLLFLQILAVPLVVSVYSCLRGEGIFKETQQRSSGILAGSPGSRLELLLEKADACVVVIIIVSAILCAASGIVVAVLQDVAGAPLEGCLILISGLLCRIAFPLSIQEPSFQDQ